ncbi:hypothetical protein [Amylibacter sp. IMCC11727]|uniref:hypothetical protein n=1 Tax=Amylibacter sp. IMCC11727 TaxID=3039851 RepID=UPI00244DF3FD|nr:hypothetical protein [Amylibacter sp. IMCC11727]WGI20404.1 hypothetical protein QBD29_09755 [Amylibacter sp. IMCC11727]
MHDSDINTPAPYIEPPVVVRTWEIITASFIGGSFLTIADLLFNRENAVTSRMSYVFEKLNMGMLAGVGFETAAFFVFLLMGLGLCFVYQPRNRPQAFVRGSSVFGVLVSMNTAATLTIAAPAVAQMKSHTIENQTIEMTLQKPRSYGPFGLGTVLNGDSNARLEKRQVQDLNSVPCVEEFSVGRETFCGVEANELRSHIPEYNIPTGIDRIYLKHDIQSLN